VATRAAAAADAPRGGGVAACCAAPRGGGPEAVAQLPVVEAGGTVASPYMLQRRWGPGGLGANPDPHRPDPAARDAMWAMEGLGLAQALIFRAMVAAPYPTPASRTRCCLGRAIVVADARGGWSSGCAGSRAKVLLGLPPLPATTVPWCIVLLLEGVVVRTSTSKDCSR
jgi:hypothetical protein